MRQQRWQLQCADKQVDLSTPKVMGVLNLSADSFSGVGRCQSLDEVKRLAETMVTDGVAIIDVGAEPTNPYQNPNTPLQQEMDLVLPAIECLTQFPVPISCDTSKPEIMLEAAKLGLGLINDVRALRLPGALEAAATTQLPVCLVHMAYPDGLTNVKSLPPVPAADLLDDIINFLQQRIAACEQAGIARHNIIVDPGIGGGSFGKTPQQNCYLLKESSALKQLACPILIGASRKTVIYRTLNIAIEESLPGSLVAAAVAVANGAHIIRTHDVKETVQAVNMACAIAQATFIQVGELINE